MFSICRLQVRRNDSTKTNGCAYEYPKKPLFVIAYPFAVWGFQKAVLRGFGLHRYIDCSAGVSFETQEKDTSFDTWVYASARHTDPPPTLTDVGGMVHGVKDLVGELLCPT